MKYDEAESSRVQRESKKESNVECKTSQACQAVGSPNQAKKNGKSSNKRNIQKTHTNKVKKRAKNSVKCQAYEDKRKPKLGSNSRK